MEDEETYDSLDHLLRSIRDRPWWKTAWVKFRWRVLKPIRHLPLSIRCFIQRGRRGWSDRDMWGMAGYLARLNVEMLAELRRIAHGSPAGLSTGDLEGLVDPEGLGKIEAQIAEIDAQIGYHGPLDDSYERWMAMLAYFEEGWRAFQTFDETWDDDDWKKFRDMMPLYANWFGGLWD